MKTKKNVYFVQAGNLYGNNTYFPYAAGCLAAYAWENPIIREQYQLGHFTFLRTPVAQAAAAFEDPFMVAFSSYVWNYEYHKALAQTIKARWPDCLILFGGHQVYNSSSEQLAAHPFMDFLIHGAGEIPFEKLLLALLDGGQPSEVPSLSYRDAEGNIQRTKEAGCESCNYPSPYLAGIFDSLFTEYPHLLFSMTVETNRGCPYGCAFCDWGASRKKLQCIPLERVKAEIDWAVQHEIEFILCADGNFGILERDEEIVDYVIESNRRTGYPKKFNTAYAKNSNETVFRLNRKLNAQGLNSGATLSFQSLSPVALENIGRKNLAVERFQELILLYNQANVPVYTDLIVGLPGETLDSFAHGVGQLLAAGMRGTFEVFPCQLLPNAELASASFLQKHGIESIRIRQVHNYVSPENQDEINEYFEIVRQTNTMPAEDWIATFLFSAVVQSFHGLGLLPHLADYLFWENQLPYERFYLDLIRYAKASPSSLVGQLLSRFEQRYRELSQGKGESLVYYDTRFGEVTWPISGALFLCAAFESQRFYAELPGFLQQYHLDPQVQAELIRFQQAMLYLPVPAEPRQVFAYDFPGYFTAVLKGLRPVLEKRRAALFFPQQPEARTWPDFARDMVWYGRRKLARKEFEVQYE